jgi:hypothetical protein
MAGAVSALNTRLAAVALRVAPTGDAMWEQVDRILRQATGQIADHVADFLPGVLVLVVLLMGAAIAAVLVRVLLVRALRSLEFDRRAHEFGFTVPAHWSPATTPSLVVARTAQWTILVLGLLVSLTALNASIPSQLAMSLFEYVPHLLAALMIVICGGLVARFVARAVLIEAVNMRIQSARLLSLTVKWLVLLVTVAMALDHLGIGRRILPIAFGIIFGGVVLAGALALGLGAKDQVGRALERQMRESAADDDRFDHV